MGKSPVCNSFEGGGGRGLGWGPKCLGGVGGPGSREGGPENWHKTFQKMGKILLLKIGRN